MKDQQEGIPSLGGLSHCGIELTQDFFRLADSLVLGLSRDC